MARADDAWGDARVVLVGAGPGDPGLLTCRGRDLLTSADCVVHDHLVGARVLALIPAAAERIDVGKRGGAASTSQDTINHTLVACAARHRRVVRLKGGDPFLFGRGGEEAAALADAHLPFAIVPGVTAGTGVPAYAGIPVTHRAASSAVAFVTGHQQAGETTPMDWASFAKIETLVLYMGMHRLADNCAALIAHGRAADTPACAIQWGTLPEQRTVTGTLATLPARVREAGLGAPAITVVGEVVAWRDRIRWFDLPARRPLHNRRVLVTRAQEQSGALAAALIARGAGVVEIPLARIAPPTDPAALARALAEAAAARAWIAFTSANAVTASANALAGIDADARALAGARLAAVGAATAHALARRGLRADLLAPQANADSLGRALATLAPTAILLPQADNARPELADLLRSAGWTVTTATAYRSVTIAPDPALLTAPYDAAPFASSATVDRFVTAIGAERARHLATAGCRFVAIGQRTAATLAAHGLPVAATARAATVAGLADAVVTALPPTPG
jgi:uroporphyrinogen III methyltransferase/synthase